jgi:antimicrobial peptide system SdpB family protein
VSEVRPTPYERARDAAAPWSPAYGLARTLLALATAGTLALTTTSKLFSPAVGQPDPPTCRRITRAGLFCLARSHLHVAQLAAVVVLLVVASGWRPRWTALPHWWLTWSVIVGVTLQDGGDQAAAVLTLLLLPVALLDRRRWHWNAPRETLGERPGARSVATLFLWIVRIQVAFIYLHSSVAKLGQPDWVDGTAMYYWYRDRIFGFPHFALPVAQRFFGSALGTVAMTWGVIVLEASLAVAGLFGSRWVRRRLLVAGILLHAGIGVFLGLGSFAMTMTAALVLLLVRPDELRLPPLRRRAAAPADAVPGRADALAEAAG